MVLRALKSSQQLKRFRVTILGFIITIKSS
nr:MAG TPA: hypothetical protein [Caudoviricetes sp.]